MDRRAFIKSLFAIGTVISIDTDLAISELLEKTKTLDDADFVYYATWYMNLFFDNPAQNAIITDISE